MIHLAWLDHCPNTVVECLSQKTPVICSEHGGTKELVSEYGIVVKESLDYNFELVDYSNPPKLQISQIQSLPDKLKLTYNVDVTMSTCLNNYLNFMEKI